MIYNKYLESGINEKISTIIDGIKKIVSFKIVIFLVLSVILSMQNINNETSLLSYLTFALASAFHVPLIIVLFSSFVGLALSSLTTLSIIKLISFFILFTFITSIINIEGISRKYDVFIKFIISVMIIEVVSNFIMSTLFTNVISIATNLFIVSSLYFIFVSRYVCYFKYLKRICICKRRKCSNDCRNYYCIIDISKFKHIIVFCI